MGWTVADLWLLHVIAPHVIALAQVQTAARHYRVRPARPLSNGNFERAFLLVAAGRGIDQGHDAVLIADIQVPVGIRHGCGTSALALAAFLPAGHDLAGLEVGTVRIAALIP